MTRALLFLVATLAAAAAAGCTSGSSRSCSTQSLLVYWRPVAGSNAGFHTPDLPTAGFPARLDCDQAGVDNVDVIVGGVSQACGTYCRNGHWMCDLSTGGLEVPLSPGLGYPLQVKGYDAAGNLKYETSTLGFDIVSCQAAPTVVDAVPAGVSGPLGLDYAFTDTSSCASGGNGSFMWFDLRDSAGVLVDQRDRNSANPYVFRCGDGTGGSVNPIPILGGTSLPAGVYQLLGMEEVVDNGDGTSSSFHGSCTGTTPAYLPRAYVHAGPDSFPVDLPLLPSGVLTCFP
jgi:hypothetical protein